MNQLPLPEEETHSPYVLMTIDYENGYEIDEFTLPECIISNWIEQW